MRIRRFPTKVAVMLVAAASVAMFAAAMPASAASSMDITDTPGTVSAEFPSPVAGEGIERVIDNSPFRKYYVDHATGWIQFTANTSATVTSYTLTSANDFPERDPRSWVFEASNGSGPWTTLDTRSDQSFVARFAKKSYSFTNSTAYTSYRLRVTANNGAASQLQLGDLAIIGDTIASAASPAAPTGLSVTANSYSHVTLSWADNTLYESGYRLERSTNGSTWTTVKVLPISSTEYHDTKLTGSTTYYYRLRAENGSTYTSTVNVTTPSGTPVTNWQETWPWLDHANKLLPLHSVSGNVVTYRDPILTGVNLDWATNLAHATWQHVEATYAGSAGNRVNVLLHRDPDFSFAVSNFDYYSGYQNAVDISLSASTDNTVGRDTITHEFAHLTENNGLNGSAAIGIWGDGPWPEIFQYDVYLVAGYTADATRWYSDKIGSSNSNYPHAGHATYWFRDWFLPIYQDHGGAQALKKFFELQTANFYTFNGVLVREMNLGEFIHFWSGAAGVDLSSQAITAFGNDSAFVAQWQAQLAQAKLDFPGVTYPTGTNTFSISLNPASATVTAGGSTTTTVSTATTGGSPQSVALTASGQPSGVTVNFSPATVTSGASATTTITVGAGVPAGNYPITITGTGSQTQTATYTLTVQANGGNCSGLPVWNATTVYVYPDVVSHDGRRWRAKWWTQSQEPGTTGEWGVWEDLGVC